VNLGQVVLSVCVLFSLVAIIALFVNDNITENTKLIKFGVIYGSSYSSY
jgi:hypothetical protein